MVIDACKNNRHYPFAPVHALQDTAMPELMAVNCIRLFALGARSFSAVPHRSTPLMPGRQAADMFGQQEAME
jgi:hypothetical protein